MTARSLPSIRGRLTRTLALFAPLSSLVITGAVWYILTHEIDELMDQGLRESAELIHNVLAVQAREPSVSHEGGQDHHEYEEHLIWQVIEKDSGQVRLRSHKAPATAMRTAVSPELTDSADGRWRIATLDFRRGGPRFLLVAQDHAERVEARSEALQYTLVAALVTGLLATLVLHLALRREMRFLSRFSDDVRTFDPLLPGTRPRSAERAELEPIERAVTELGQRIAQRVLSERAFNAHAAHALRTPLAGIDAQLAVALREVPPNVQPRLLRVRTATTRLRHVMQALLAMHRSGIEPHAQAIDLAELLAPLNFNGLQLDVRQTAPLHADPDLLAAVLMNLLDNAQRHEARTVQLEVQALGGCVRLSLQDDGQGCDEATLARLRLALERHDHSGETGLRGLGLILADLVMQAHGGSVQLPDTARGFRVELRWPLSSSARQDHAA